MKKRKIYKAIISLFAAAALMAPQMASAASQQISLPLSFVSEGCAVFEMNDVPSQEEMQVSCQGAYERYEIRIAQTVLAEMAKQNSRLCLRMGEYMIDFPVKNFPDSALVLAVGKLNANTQLSPPEKKALAQKDKYYFEAYYNGAWQESFPAAVTLKMPYSLEGGEQEAAVCAFRLAPVGGANGQPGYGYYGDRANYAGDAAMAPCLPQAGRYQAGFIHFRTNKTGVFAGGENRIAFSDVGHGYWAQQEIGALAACGVLQGVGEAFLPDEPLTRAQAATMLVLASGALQNGLGVPFLDTAPKDWFYNACASAKAAGILLGDENYCRPLEAVSRQDFFVMAMRLLEGTDTERAGLDRFLDSNAVQPYAKESLEQAAALGVLQGYNGKINPNDCITRAQAAKVVKMMLDLLVEI